MTPSKKTLSAIREAIKTRDEMLILIDSSLITLEIVPVKDGSLEIIEAEQAGTLTLQAGTPTKIKGSPQVIADLPGFARLRASGPSGSIQEHKTALSNAQQSIMDMMKPFSTDKFEDLERMVEDGDNLDKKIVAINAELKTLLGEQTLEDIKQQETHLKSIQAKILLNYPKWEHNSPDPNAMKIAAEEHRRDFVNRIDVAEATHTTAVSTLSGIKEEVTKTAAKLETEGSRAKSLEKRIEDLRGDGKSDVERQQELNKAALSWDSSNAVLQEVEKKLSIFLDDPQLTTSRLEKQLEAANDAAKTTLEDEKTAEGQLQIIATQGPYSALAEIEEELSTIECRLEAERLKTDAVKLLYHTMIHNRAEMLSIVTKPVEITATRTMHRIGGEKLGRLLLSSDLAPTHIIPSGLETPVPIESLSGGEKEQIHLATRLALADVLARDTRQMVVLDDVLYVTDAGRFARVLNIIEEATKRLQIIILTCHPEKYRGLGDANFLYMETTERRV
ncbi:ATP-binding protein [Chloroflexota bacterium]